MADVTEKQVGGHAVEPVDTLEKPTVVDTKVLLGDAQGAAVPVSIFLLQKTLCLSCVSFLLLDLALEPGTYEALLQSPNFPIIYNADF
jgi:hypothetical protein